MASFADVLLAIKRTLKYIRPGLYLEFPFFLAKEPEHPPIVADSLHEQEHKNSEDEEVEKDNYELSDLKNKYKNTGPRSLWDADYIDDMSKNHDQPTI